MGKQRFTALDVKASVDEIRHNAKGMRLLNVYDLSPRVYLLKFGQGEKKVHVLFESGVRLHITNFAREKPKVPSQFTLKLRKHVRSWRLEDVRQVGGDRLVDFQFGAGDQSFHFVLEIYGQGNFFLTDSRYVIMMLLRTSKSEDVRLAVKEVYPVESAKPFVTQTLEAITEALTQAKENDTLRACLPMSFYGLLADHMLASCGLNPGEKKRVWEEDIGRVASSVFQVCAAVDAIMSRPIVGEGVLVRLQPAPGAKNATQAKTANDAPAQQSLSSSSLIASPDEFWPAVLEPFLDRSRIAQRERTPTFSEAADRCFRGTEQEKIDTHNQQKEKMVLSKKEKFLRDHQRRIDGLIAEQDRNRQLGELIQANVEEVDMAINLVNDVLRTGMSWEALGSLIRVRQAEGHPVANVIHELKLYKNSISILLSQDCADDDEVEDADLEPVVVDVDIGLSAYANAAKYHSQKKTVAKKLERTIDSTEKAADAAEKKGERIAKKVVEKRDIITIRTPMWFEKFHWFLTSHGHVVVAGHDATQADMLFKRYSMPGDVFVHCDAPNALPALVKNPNNGNVPLPSVEEAGIMCISRTEAWRKAPVSAWWCLAAQVSKKLPTAEHQLAPGQFSVKGAKTYMPAMQLQLAVGVLFRTDRLRPPRESGSAVSYINVAESLKNAAANDIADAAARPKQPSPDDLLNNTNSSSAPPIGTRQSSQDMDEDGRQTSGDTTDPQSPNAARSANGDGDGETAFPSGTTPPSSGGLPLSKKLKHLRRGQGSAHSTSISESGDGGSEHLTISLASTRTAPTKPVNRAAAGPTPTSAVSPIMPTPQPITQQQLNSRTQNKLKKIRKKYAEQDDEDRQRAMALIGNSVSKVHQAFIQEEAVRKHNAAQAALAEGADASDESHDLGATSDEDTEGLQVGSSGKQVTFAKSRSTTETFDETTMEREHEEMNRRASSFDDDTVKIQERIQLEAAVIVPYLDGCPSVADDIQFNDVVLVCAPYASIRHYAIKTRIAPGNEKKGAASASILHTFLQEITVNVPGASTAAKQLTADMLIGQLPSTIKVHRGEAGIGAGASLRSVTKDSAAAQQAAEQPSLSGKQLAAAKKEQAAKALEERLRAERRARLEAKAACASGGGAVAHVDPSADAICA